MIRNVYILVALFLVSVGGTAQENSKKELSVLAEKMFQDGIKRDYDAILDMTHPKMFEIVPKETMKGVLKSTFEGNQEFAITLPETAPEYTISPISVSDSLSVSYAFVGYDMEVNMTFKNQTFDDAAKDIMKSMMEAQGMKVKFVSNASIDLVMKNSVTILIKDQYTEGKWAMVNYDADNPMFYQVLPKFVIEQARAYRQELMLSSAQD